MFFAGWHTHYSSYDYDYGEMKNDIDIMGLLKGDIGAMTVTSSERWLCSTLCS